MTTLTKGEQFIYDWQYGRHDKRSFKGLLAQAMARADSAEWAKLFKGFPDEAIAMDNFHHKKGWWDMVLDKADTQHLVIMKDHSPQTRVATKEE